MINKVIHYCWFGKNEKSLLIEECIDSWKKYCPDYEIIEWNEDNFDIESNIFTKEAYENKKWAFVSDYVRLYVLKEYGGIYLDTDVEITQNLDKFLEYKFFSGKESSEFIITSVIGSIKDGEIVKKLIKYYDNKKFVLNDGSLDMTTNTKIITDVLIKNYSINKLDNEIKISDNEIIFNENYFCNKKIDKDNYVIHHFEGSWISRDILLKELQIYRYKIPIIDKLVKFIEEEEENKNDVVKKIIEKLKDRKIYIWGVGSIGILLRNFLKKININNVKLIDSNVIKLEMEIYKVEECEFKQNDLVIVCFKEKENKLSLYNKVELINVYDLLLC